LIFNFILPIFTALIFIVALIKKVNILESFLEGAREGLKTVLNILPVLMIMLTVINMFRFSGGMNFLIKILTPAAKLLNLPPEVLPVAVLKPFSGSGSLAMVENVLKTYGADSRIGRIAAVLAASTETTFYTISIYLGSLNKKCGKIIICALIGDICAIIMASFLL
jgi:spore maturation protein B